MPQLPRSIWIIAMVVGLVLVGLCAITLYAVLKATARARVTAWPTWRIVVLAVAATVPWLVVSFAEIRVSVSINGLLQLIGWLIVALGAFALLVLLPLIAIVSVAVWLTAHFRGDKGIRATSD